MLKVLRRIARARAARSAEDLADRNALLILDGQMRDAARAADGCRRALALAAAQDEAEGRRIAGLTDRIRDLEQRTAAALRDGADDLAARGAEAIAALDADRADGTRDRNRFADAFARLRAEAAAAERRLADLGRGRRAAEAAEAVRRLRADGGGTTAGRDALTQAEHTLARLRALQARDADAERIHDGLARDGSAVTVLAALERAGYGPPSGPGADAVLQRLRLGGPA